MGHLPPFWATCASVSPPSDTPYSTDFAKQAQR